MCEESNEKLINFFIEKQKGGCGKKMESLTDYIIKITVIEKTDDLIKECKKLLQIGIENGANMIMLALDLGVTKEKLLEYYDKNLIDYWEKEFKKIKSCIKEEGEGE
jgi:hypothetical protein